MRSSRYSPVQAAFGLRQEEKGTLVWRSAALGFWTIELKPGFSVREAGGCSVLSPNPPKG